MIIGPDPRLDTIAHKIGHNLGLDHTTFGAGPSVPANLMTDGNYRTIPTRVSQITSGVTDNLTAAQITLARSPLFSVGNLVETASVDRLVGPISNTRDPNGQYMSMFEYSPTVFPNGALNPPIASPASLPTETLTDVKVRFLPGTQAALYIQSGGTYTNGQPLPTGPYIGLSTRPLMSSTQAPSPAQTTTRRTRLFSSTF
jgi:hypothetical protein